MANQYNFKGNEEFEKKKEQTATATLIFWVLTIVIMIVIFVMISEGKGGLKLFPIFCVGAIITVIRESLTNKSKAMEANSTGRNIAEQSLETLPNSFTVLSDVYLENDESSTVYDSIVVGKTGIYVITTCNRNGELVGGPYDQMWEQNKVGRGGTPYTNEFKNPLKKLYFQRKFMERFLKDNGVNVKVNGFLILPMAKSFTCESYEVVKSQEDLNNKIKNAKGVSLSPETVEKIVGLFEK